MFPSGIISIFLLANFALIYNLTTQFMSSLFLALRIQFPFTNRFNFKPTKRQRPISSWCHALKGNGKGNGDDDDDDVDSVSW